MKKKLIISLILVIIIFLIGFLIRLDSVNLHSIPDNEKSFFQDANGLPYMYDMDSYYNYRLTQNYLDHGYLGDIKINGTNWDFHSYFPTGRSAEYPPLIVYLTALIYMLVNLFTTVPLLTICFWLPAFIAPLCGIHAYLFVKKYSNEYGGFAAGVLAVTAPMYFLRTVPGWFDTDMFNILFPLLVSWFFIEAVNCDNWKKQVIYTLLTSFSLLIFSIAWQGWVYLFYIIMIVSIIYILASKLRNTDLNNFINVFIIFLGSFSVLTFIFTGLYGFKTLNFPFQFIETNSTNLWPVIYYSITELQKPSIYDVIVALLPFIVVILIAYFLNFVLTLKRTNRKHFLKNGHDNLFLYLFLVLWIIIGFLTLMKGIRFIMLLIPPFVIVSGIIVGNCIENIMNLNIRKNVSIILSILIVSLITITPIIIDHDLSYNLIPRADDNLNDGTIWIKENTRENTVVISHWVYGYFFQAIGNRPTLYDGGSQNTPREFWIDFAFTANNESLSSGIFQMLATSGDEGYLTLDEYTKNTKQTVEILKNILGVNRTTAREKLTQEYHLNETQSENVLKYTHPQKTNPYILITYDEMISAGEWIFYFGTWDFNSMNGMNSSYSYGNIIEENNLLKTDNGIEIDLKSNNLTVNKVLPYFVAKISKGKVEKKYLDNNSDLCVYLLMDSKEAVIINKKYENSLFTKLVIEKTNTAQFKSVYMNEDVSVWESKK